jgi:hypothetical protein
VPLVVTQSYHRLLRFAEYVSVEYETLPVTLLTHEHVRGGPPGGPGNVSHSCYRAGHGDLAELASLATRFAAREHLTIVPAVPEHGCGPEVSLGPDELGLSGFLELAGKLGGGVLYLRAAPFDPDAVDGGDQQDESTAHLIAHKGQTGQVSVAFAANGLVHFWEHRTAWYLEWEELADGIMTGAGRYEAERARLVGELADAIVADPKFRAARVTDRWDLSGKAIPAGTDSWVGRDARRQACTRTYQMAQERYDQLEDQLDDLAAELLASPACQQASSADARKNAAARFLIPRADGFSPPTSLIPNELHARAQKLAKAARASASGLF